MASGVPGNLGPYRLLNVVHTSRASRIWQAYDDRNGRMVGIKTLQEEYHKDREQIGYLRWEYFVGQKVTGERIIQMLGFGTDRGCPYLAMEWFSSSNLKHKIREGIGQIAYLLPKIIEQSAEALECFNAAGFVHRDVKPDNFLVTDEGMVKLIDFALARRKLSGLGKLLASKPKVQGTRSYMAPEQIRGSAVDQRTDVYAFGCAVYELLAGKLPFTAPSADELLYRHLKAAPPSLEATAGNVTPEFAQLVRSSMAKDPANRPQSLGDFLIGMRMCRIFKVAPQPPERGED